MLSVLFSASTVIPFVSMGTNLIQTCNDKESGSGSCTQRLHIKIKLSDPKQEVAMIEWVTMEMARSLCDCFTICIWCHCKNPLCIVVFYWCIVQNIYKAMIKFADIFNVGANQKIWKYAFIFVVPDSIYLCQSIPYMIYFTIIFA